MNTETNEHETTMYYIILNNRGKAINKKFPIKHLDYLCDMLSLYNRDIHHNYIAVWNPSYNPNNWLDDKIEKLTSILDILEVDYDLAKRC